MSNNKSISSSDSSTDFNYKYYIQEQLKTINHLKQIIDEINVSKIFPSYLLQLKVQRIYHSWTGRGTTRVFRYGVGNDQ